MQSVWRVHPASPLKAESLARAVGIHPITAQFLLNRGIDNADAAQRFFSAGI